MTNHSHSQSAEAALRERVKELACLYEIAQLAGQPGTSLEAILLGIAELVRRAWQYPEIASVRLLVDGQAYATSAFREGPQKQTAQIVTSGVARGFVEVAYAEPRPELDEGPFLKEERTLIDAVAGQIALILDRREAERDRLNLQNQLRHADRLATIGQLAAGVAHELNEPLGNILGFAQLAEKCSGLPDEARADIEKITGASLRAREIIKKLLVFARQNPPQRTRVDLNRLAEEGVRFFDARCAEQGVEFELELSPDLPEITADPAQLSQVLVNLVVNALQAMPDGGKLAVRTNSSGDQVSIVVEDTGTGMSQDVIDKLFVPFFTTKDVGEGTGLGLPVAHGIVASHGGSITVHSTMGQGTRFELHLPQCGGESPSLP